jgi:hypothetical protein
MIWAGTGERVVTVEKEKKQIWLLDIVIIYWLNTLNDQIK